MVHLQSATRFTGFSRVCGTEVATLGACVGVHVREQDGNKDMFGQQSVISLSSHNYVL